MDKYHEQLLTTRKSPLFALMTVLMVFLGFLAVMALPVLTRGFNAGILLAFLVCAGGAAGAYFLRDKVYREYEYAFANGNLQIDVIYNMKKRKIVLDKDVKDFKEFGRLTESGLSKDIKRIVCYPFDKKNSGDIYYILIADRKRSAYLIIPDKEMLSDISLYYKRRVR